MSFVPPLKQKGFSLAELAIVLVIVALLLGGLLVPLSAQNDSRQISETQQTLSDIRDALVGYAAANGRLPCPATAASNGVESPPPPGVGNCNSVVANNHFSGFVPAATLGIGPTDDSGYAIDAWGNRIHYAVTAANGSAFTTPNGMRMTTMAVLAPDLRVCADAACATPLTTGGAVAVIYSTAKNSGTGGAGADEAQNPNPNGGSADRDFVSHTPTQATAPGGEFDDIVIWLAPGTLYNRMIAAGQLP